MTGIEVAAAAARRLPGVRSLIVTTFGRPGYVRRALEAGAAGFVVKDTPARELADAVRRVHAGLRVVDPDAGRGVADRRPVPLTAREAEILPLRARRRHRSPRSPAPLHLSQGTVRNHLSAAIGKTGATHPRRGGADRADAGLAVTGLCRALDPVGRSSRPRDFQVRAAVAPFKHDSGGGAPWWPSVLQEVQDVSAGCVRAGR